MEKELTARTLNEACAQELMRLRREAEDAQESIDKLTFDLEQAWWNLAAVAGSHRADEIMDHFRQNTRNDEAAEFYDHQTILTMCAEKIVAGEANRWMHSYYFKNRHRFPGMPLVSELLKRGKEMNGRAT